MADANKKSQKESEWWVEEQKEARGDKAEKPVVAAGSSFFTTVEDYDQVAAEKNLTDLNQKLLSEGGAAAGEFSQVRSVLGGQRELGLTGGADPDKDPRAGLGIKRLGGQYCQEQNGKDTRET